MLQLFRSFYYAFCYFISPPFCSYCKKWLEIREIFCQNCFKKINPIVSTKISLTESLEIPVISISNYEGPIKNLILAKHSRNRLASFYLGRLICQQTIVGELDFDIIVPIPLHWSRKIKRGYNQVDAISSEISKITGKPIKNILRRKKLTYFQAKLTKTEREENLKNAFYTKSMSDLVGKRVLLVDDLMTTGSTFKSAAKTLMQYKPKSITCVVAARVV